MEGAEKQKAAPVKTKAVLIDSAAMTVDWMNESAAQDVSDEVSDSVPGAALDRAVPIARLLGVPEALATAVSTGTAQHRRANLVSTSKGNMLIVASVYPLPTGKVLLLMEHAWQAGRGTSSEGTSRRPRHRTP